jgi:ATP-dependent Clp protease protease subunit
MNTAKRTAINFCSPITPHSISALITVAQKALNEGTKEIKILITSGGGDPNAALSAYNFLRGMPVQVTTHNYGICDSAALILYCAGKNRLSCSEAKFLIHESRVDIKGANANKCSEAIQQLRQIEDLEANIIASNCNKTKEDIINFMRGESAVLDAKRGKEWQLVMEITNDLLQVGDRAIVINMPQPNPV